MPLCPPLMKKEKRDKQKKKKKKGKKKRRKNRNKKNRKMRNKSITNICPGVHLSEAKLEMDRGTDRPMD